MSASSDIEGGSNSGHMAPTPASAVENSVVKVFSTVQYPDPYKPWTKAAPTEVTGSGVVIDGKRILTSAHVVLHAAEVQVRSSHGGDKISARVDAIAPGIDLALLKLEDDKIFDSHSPLRRDPTIPAIREGTIVYGYPTGGLTLSATKGIVSRIEFTPINYPVYGLRIQIDAAINPGSSGGPALIGDKMVGLAFSYLGGTQNIGYIIPDEEIELFLRNVADGHYDGKPAIYDLFQRLENPALRAFLKLDSSVNGIIVHQPKSRDSSYPLKEWDVITKIGDVPIDDQGMIQVRPDLKLDFRYLVQKLARHARIPLTVLRRGKRLDVDLPTSTDLAMALPEDKGKYPSYFVFGPLVFSQPTADLVTGLAKPNKGADWLLALAYTQSPLIRRYGDPATFDGERIVFVSSPFFPHKLSKGYDNPAPQVIKTVNGHEVKNLAHLVQILRDSKDEFIVIEFYTRGGEALVFARQEMIDATDEILSDNGLRRQGSPDVLAIWNGKANK